MFARIFFSNYFKYYSLFPCLFTKQHEPILARKVDGKKSQEIAVACHAARDGQKYENPIFVLFNFSPMIFLIAQKSLFSYFAVLVAPDTTKTE
jgi:hypothetical protein